MNNEHNLKHFVNIVNKFFSSTYCICLVTKWICNCPSPVSISILCFRLSIYFRWKCLNLYKNFNHKKHGFVQKNPISLCVRVNTIFDIQTTTHVSRLIGIQSLQCQMTSVKKFAASIFLLFHIPFAVWMSNKALTVCWWSNEKCSIANVSKQSNDITTWLADKIGWCHI